jgi:aspartate racemase
MKTIGIVGGLAWPSTAEYYRLINQEVSRLMGGSGRHCAKLVLAQTDFDAVERAQAADDWDAVAALIAEQVNLLKAAGADFYIIACNTVHKAMPRIEAASDLPYIHIADPAAQACVDAGYKTVGLMGSGYTMGGTYFTGRLENKYGLSVLLPDEAQREFMQRALYGELVKGVFLPETRAGFSAVIDGLARRGAQAVILGCTEFGLLVGRADSALPLIDTAREHAKAAAIMAVKG